MKFILTGIPQSKDRPRFFKTKDGIRSYDPKSKKKQDTGKALQILIFEAMSSELDEICSEAVDLTVADFYHVSLAFYLPIPKSDSKRQKKAKLEGLLKPTTKPDLDNLEKFILDAMNGIFFADDKQVVKLASEKIYSEQPRTEIEIKGYFHGNKGPS